MPNKKAGFKSLRQDKKKHDRNKTIVSELKTITKKARLAISEKNATEADKVLKLLEAKLDKAAKKNIIKKNNAARKVSNLRSQWAAIKA